MAKPTICICKIERCRSAVQCSNCTADQRFCFRCSNSTILLLLKSKICSLYPAYVTVQASLCRTWWEIQISGFLMHMLMYLSNIEDQQARTRLLLYCASVLFKGFLWLPLTFHVVNLKDFFFIIIICQWTLFLFPQVFCDDLY